MPGSVVVVQCVKSAHILYAGNGAASGSGGLALRSGGVTASNNVAAAAADLLKVASAHLNDCEDSSAGAQQTVFVEEVLDDEDISDMPVTTSSGN